MITNLKWEKIFFWEKCHSISTLTIKKIEGLKTNLLLLPVINQKPQKRFILSCEFPMSRFLIYNSNKIA